MIEQSYDASSINAYTNSYHTLSRVNKTQLGDKRQLPLLDSYIFLSAHLSTNHLRELLQRPIFTFPPWTKFKTDLKNILKKVFYVKLKEISQGNILIIPPGESINLRADYFCLAPHEVYTLLVPLQKCDINSATVAVSEPGLKWKANCQEELLQNLQKHEFKWEYANLQSGDVLLIGRDCVYGSFRNDSKEVKHYAEFRMVKYEQSSSSSNSS